jgi:putative transposase
MGTATTTIKQVLNYQPQHAASFVANQALFNQVASFYFDVIQAHEMVLDHPQKEALTILERLTHATKKNPNPVMPLQAIAKDVPAMFRRAAINAALGSARSFFSHLKKWRARKEKALARGKKWSERPPVPPRAWNKSVPFYAGQWRERTASSIRLKVWTGSNWSWIKVRITGREVPSDAEIGSSSLICHGKQWWLHTPVETLLSSPAKISKQVRSNGETKICAIDLNLGEHIAVCTIQTVEGTILATQFIGGGRAISGFRKHQLGWIARNRRKTGILAKGEQDNVTLWRKIQQRDEDLAHQVSARIVQFASTHGATILAFEHLGSLKPEKGRYSHRGNSKRAFWMKGRIFRYTKYKAWAQAIITSRINPRNTSRECAQCHGFVVRYQDGQAAQGYTTGAPLVLCQACHMHGNADRNASLVIGQRLIARAQNVAQEKPPTPLLQTEERVVKTTGVSLSQVAKSRRRPSTHPARHGAGNEHGTAQERALRMDEPLSHIAHQLRFPFEL